MAAPSKNFTSIVDSAIDADSPLDTTLMTQIRDSLVHLEEWLGMSYTAAQDHDHDGANSKSVVSVADGSVTTAKIAASAVTIAKLSMATGSWSGNLYGLSSIDIATNRYFHINQTYGQSGKVYISCYGATAWTTGIRLVNDVSSTSPNNGISWDYHN